MVKKTKIDDSKKYIVKIRETPEGFQVWRQEAWQAKSVETIKNCWFVQVGFKTEEAAKLWVSKFVTMIEGEIKNIKVVKND